MAKSETLPTALAPSPVTRTAPAATGPQARRSASSPLLPGCLPRPRAFASGFGVPETPSPLAVGKGTRGGRCAVLLSALLLLRAGLDFLSPSPESSPNRCGRGRAPSSLAGRSRTRGQCGRCHGRFFLSSGQGRVFPEGPWGTVMSRAPADTPDTSREETAVA